MPTKEEQNRKHDVELHSSSLSRRPSPSFLHRFLFLTSQIVFLRIVKGRFLLLLMFKLRLGYKSLHTNPQSFPHFCRGQRSTNNFEQFLARVEKGLNVFKSSLKRGKVAFSEENGLGRSYLMEKI